MTATSPDALVARFRNRERPALARLVTLVENERPAGLQALAELYRDTGNARVIGITGPPGAGKSTLTNALIRAWRARNLTVGVLAIDPSSSLTGGATLGDRIRMLENYDDDGVYIRSMATRGEMGGLSAAVGSVAHLLDAWGFDIVCIETVGVGQDEVDIGELADTTLLLQVPGLGDAIQTIKAGVLEIADILVVNKRDIPGANDLVRDLRTMLRLGEYGAWTPPIVETSATTSAGVDALIGALDKHCDYLATSGTGAQRAARRNRAEVLRLARRSLARVLERVVADGALEPLIEDLAARRTDPITVGDALAQQAAHDLQRQRQSRG